MPDPRKDDDLYAPPQAPTDRRGDREPLRSRDDAQRLAAVISNRAALGLLLIAFSPAACFAALMTGGSGLGALGPWIALGMVILGIVMCGLCLRDIDRYNVRFTPPRWKVLMDVLVLAMVAAVPLAVCHGWLGAIVFSNKGQL